MREQRVAHGALDLEHVVMIEGVPTIVDFSLASVSAPQQRLDRDVANLLVSSALLVGPERAIAAAEEGLGKDALVAALPLLSKPALSRATCARLRHEKKLLDQLQQDVSTKADIAIYKPVELRRVKPLTVVMIIGVLFALWVILGEVGSLRELFDTLKTADWPWVVACAVLTQLTQVSYAFTTIGSVDEKVPLGPAVLMQYAVAFTNLVLPTGAASTLMNIRFLQKQGSSVAVATSSGVLVGLSGTITQFFLFFFTAWAVGQQVDTGEIGGTGGAGDDAKLILLGVVAAAVLLGIVFVVPKLRRFTQEKVWPQLRNGLHNVWSVLIDAAQALPGDGRQHRRAAPQLARPRCRVARVRQPACRSASSSSWSPAPGSSPASCRCPVASASPRRRSSPVSRRSACHRRRRRRRSSRTGSSRRIFHRSPAATPRSG